MVEIQGEKNKWSRFNVRKKQRMCHTHYGLAIYIKRQKYLKAKEEL
jgi:hypothetical protein